MVGTPAQALSPDASAARDASNAFAVDLYGRLASQRSGNLFFAPQIISTALALPYAGARGDTAAEIARTLHLALPQDHVPGAYAALLGILSGSGGDRADYHLSIATRLWAQRGTAFLNPFLATARNAYGADVEPVDFGKDSDQIRRQINAWVQQATANKIHDLNPGTLEPTTRLVLANAIYFQGNWAEPFEKRATRDAPFHVSTSRTVQTRLMSGKIFAGYAEHPEAALKVLALPYQGRDLSMVVLLPDTPDDLANLEARLTTETITAWTSTLQDQILVYLPRFSVESNLALTQPLADMGMASAFSRRADFSGMNGQRDMLLSAVVHKARVDVDEQGTEAAAATEMDFPTLAVRRKELVFRADHPFVFLIRHDPTGAILFLGRIVDPTSLT